jgi:hypothetical protein
MGVLRSFIEIALEVARFGGRSVWLPRNVRYAPLAGKEYALGEGP